MYVVAVWFKAVIVNKFLENEIFISGGKSGNNYITGISFGTIQVSEDLNRTELRSHKGVPVPDNIVTLEYSNMSVRIGRNEALLTQ